MRADAEVRNLKVTFQGSCRDAAGRSTADISVPATGDTGEYEAIMLEIGTYISGKVAFMVLCRGMMLKKLYDDGGSVREQETLTAIPVVLGG